MKPARTEIKHTFFNLVLACKDTEPRYGRARTINKILHKNNYQEICFFGMYTSIIKNLSMKTTYIVEIQTIFFIFYISAVVEDVGTASLQFLVIFII